MCIILFLYTVLLKSSLKFNMRALQNELSIFTILPNIIFYQFIKSLPVLVTFGIH
jgi:hypothetical protein